MICIYSHVYVLAGMDKSMA